MDHEHPRPPHTYHQPINHPVTQTKVEPHKHPASPELYKLRKYFVYVLVGGLIVSAVVAIIAVLIGSMTGIVGKAIMTIVTVITHSLIALAFISVTDSKLPNKGSGMVINTLFGITVLSLIVSLLGIWDVIADNTVIFRQYSVFFAALVTAIVIYGLFQATERDRSTIISRNTAIGSSLGLFVLLLPILYRVNGLADFYHRLVIATSIVVGVSTIITVIFHWYYVSRNPEVGENGVPKVPMTLGQLIGRGILVLITIWIVTAVFVAIYNATSVVDFNSHSDSSSLYY